MENCEITVCIHCMTYNHEKYLADALEGFVMQKTTFPFVAVVIDDCSTDGTADVLREYEKKYPDIIKAVYLQENYYSQHKTKQPFLEPWDRKAKYIALCEGDDYWTDPLKLQKQVNFLEMNAEYSMCFHFISLSQEENGEKTHFEKLSEKDYLPEDFYNKWAISTCTVMYRRDSYIKVYKPSPHVVFGDMYMFLLLSEVGKIRCLGFTGSVYRKLPTGMSSVNSHEMFCKLSRQYRWYSKRFGYNKKLKQLSKSQESEYISYIMYDKEYRDTWKFRFRYMFLHPQLITSTYLYTTIFKYMFAKKRNG